MNSMLIGSQPDSERSQHATASAERPIRVCFMIDQLRVAGVESQLLLLLRSLDRSKVEPYLCLLDGTSEQSRELEPGDCPVVRLGVRSLHRPSSAWKAVRFGRFLRRERIDVLQTFFADSKYFGMPVARLAGVRGTANSRLDIGFWVRPVDRWLGRLYNRLINATLVNCEACRKSVIADEHASPDSVVVVPNGLVLSRFTQVPAPRADGDDLHRVGVVANLRAVKSLDVFVRAAKSLTTAHPEVDFQIAGDGEMRAELESLIDTLGIQDRFKLLGPVEDIPTFLSGLAVAVLCSSSEGAPNAITEYMAAARPIVATSVGGNGELIEDGRYGLLVPPGNAERLAGAIGRLLSDRALAAKLGANARERAIREYGVETQARRYEQFYDDLLQRTRS